MGLEEKKVKEEDEELSAGVTRNKIAETRKHLKTKSDLVT